MPASGHPCPVSSYMLSTKSRVMKIEYRWEISNFVNWVSEDWTNISGPVIHARGTDVCWKLQMVPSCGGYLCIEVKQVDQQYGGINNTKQVSLGVCICNADNTLVYGVRVSREVPERFVEVGNGLRSKLIKREVVLENRVRYLPDGKLTVLCTLHFLQPETYTDAADQLKAPVLEVPPPEMSSGMGRVLTEGRFSDFIVVAGGREFPAHRAILAQRSEVFRAMFELDMAEKRDDRVVIEDLSADAISDLLTFIYTDSAPNIKEVAPELLAAAEKYNIPRLKAVCEEELAKSLDIDNVIDRLVQSETYQASHLKDAALYWITKHAPDVVNTTSWKSLCEQRPELVFVICGQFASYIKMLK